MRKQKRDVYLFINLKILAFILCGYACAVFSEAGGGIGSSGAGVTGRSELLNMNFEN